MLIGYARVSSDDQNLNLQKDALTRAGCERILEDRQSGAKADRPGLRDALDYARDGDTLTVWRLDRLSRSLKDLIDLVSQLEARGIGLKSLHESIDTTSSSGKLIFHVFGAGCIHPVGLIIERPFRHGFAHARSHSSRRDPCEPLVTERRIHHEATVSFVSAVWTGLSAPPVSTTSPPACDSLSTLPNEAWP